MPILRRWVERCARLYYRADKEKPKICLSYRNALRMKFVHKLSTEINTWDVKPRNPVSVRGKLSERRKRARYSSVVSIGHTSLSSSLRWSIFTAIQWKKATPRVVFNSKSIIGLVECALHCTPTTLVVMWRYMYSFHARGVTLWWGCSQQCGRLCLSSTHNIECRR